MVLRGQFHILAKETQYPLHAMLGKPQSQSEPCGEEEDLFSFNPNSLLVQPVAYLWLLPIYTRLILQFPYHPHLGLQNGKLSFRILEHILCI
jgi:hypothetical protein